MGVGLLPAENIVGRAELIVASWRPGASLFKPWTWFDVRPDRVLRPIR
jgi:signal peptidase I